MDTGVVTVDSIGYCTNEDEDGPGFWAFAGPLAAFHLSLLVITNILLYKVSGMKELRAELLRTRKDDFRRTLLRKMMAYALGRSLTLADVEAADSLAPALRERGDQMGMLVELIVASEVFQSK